ncbi:MAG: hypothetical protein MHM6MM_003244 [Cercozoa sp. M6MM]
MSSLRLHRVSQPRISSGQSQLRPGKGSQTNDDLPTSFGSPAVKRVTTSSAFDAQDGSVTTDVKFQLNFGKGQQRVSVSMPWMFHTLFDIHVQNTQRNDENALAFKLSLDLDDSQYPEKSTLTKRQQMPVVLLMRGVKLFVSVHVGDFHILNKDLPLDTLIRLPCKFPSLQSPVRASDFDKSTLPVCLRLRMKARSGVDSPIEYYRQDTMQRIRHHTSNSFRRRDTTIRIARQFLEKQEQMLEFERSVFRQKGRIKSVERRTPKKPYFGLSAADRMSGMDEPQAKRRRVTPLRATPRHGDANGDIVAGIVKDNNGDHFKAQASFEADRLAEGVWGNSSPARTSHWKHSSPRHNAGNPFSTSRSRLTPKKSAHVTPVSPHVTPRHVTPRNVTPGQVTPRQVTPKHETPKHETPKHETPRHVASKSVTPEHVPASPVTRSDLPLDELPSGLINQSCTCYLNSYLQVMFHLRVFRELVFREALPKSTFSTPLSPAQVQKFRGTLLQHMRKRVSSEQRLKTSTDIVKREIDICVRKLRERNIMREVQRLFYRLATADGVAQNTRLLTDSFGWFNDQTSRQQDAQEFVRRFWNHLDEKGEKELTKLFEGCETSRIECRHVDFTSCRSEDFHDLSLPLASVRSLRGALDGYTRAESLDGENKYDAGKHGKQDATKRLTFSRLPKVLQLHFKRFLMDWHTETVKKDSRRVQFPSTLKLHTEDENGEKTEREFSFFAAIFHHGDTINHGHYTCAIRVAKDVILNFDDTKVTQIHDLFDNPSYKRRAYYVFYLDEETTAAQFGHEVHNLRQMLASEIPAGFADFFHSDENKAEKLRNELWDSARQVQVPVVKLNDLIGTSLVGSALDYAKHKSTQCWLHPRTGLHVDGIPSERLATFMMTGSNLVPLDEGMLRDYVDYVIDKGGTKVLLLAADNADWASQNARVLSHIREKIDPRDPRFTETGDVDTFSKNAFLVQRLAYATVLCDGKRVLRDGQRVLKKHLESIRELGRVRHSFVLELHKNCREVVPVVPHLLLRCEEDQLVFENLVMLASKPTDRAADCVARIRRACGLPDEPLLVATQSLHLKGKPSALCADGDVDKAVANTFLSDAVDKPESLLLMQEAPIDLSDLCEHGVLAIANRESHRVVVTVGALALLGPGCGRAVLRKTATAFGFVCNECTLSGDSDGDNEFGIVMCSASVPLSRLFVLLSKALDVPLSRLLLQHGARNKYFSYAWAQEHDNVHTPSEVTLAIVSNDVGGEDGLRKNSYSLARVRCFVPPLFVPRTVTLALRGGSDTLQVLLEAVPALRNTLPALAAVGIQRRGGTHTIPRETVERSLQLLLCRVDLKKRRPFELPRKSLDNFVLAWSLRGTRPGPHVFLTRLAASHKGESTPVLPPFMWQASSTPNGGIDGSAMATRVPESVLPFLLLLGVPLFPYRVPVDTPARVV